MCIFCDIAEGKVSAHVIYEDESVIALLDIEPSALGHTMVIPKVHVEDFLDLPQEMMVSLLTGVQKVTKMLEAALSADNFTIGVNSGKIVGRHVNHLHVHVIPRFPDDGGGYIQSVVSNPPKEELAAIKEKIIKAQNGN